MQVLSIPIENQPFIRGADNLEGVPTIVNVHRLSENSLTVEVYQNTCPYLKDRAGRVLPADASNETSTVQK